jgi:protein-tyrosine phosphatase/arsenate reductase
VFIADRLRELQGIPQARRALLADLADAVSSRLEAGRPVRLVFICTHNSRRSQLAQLWAQAAARAFSVTGVECWSGGTEATAFNRRAVAALERAGFVVELFTDGNNPIYEVSFEPGTEPIRAFSKVYDQPPNPAAGFVAVLTCAAADTACPVVVGADDRIAIPYDDPKAADGTDNETGVYDERCREIAREMLFVFSRVSERRSMSP